MFAGGKDIILKGKIMGNKPLRHIFKIGGRYEVITKYKEIPIKAVMPLKWIEEGDRFLGFDWSKVNVKRAYSTLDNVYVKLGQDSYAQTSVFSNLGKELVLVFESIVPPPEFIRRKTLRVEPDPSQPVYANVCVDDTCSIRSEVKDISETGVGLTISRGRSGEFYNKLREILSNPESSMRIPFSITVELPDGEKVRGHGDLRNVIGLGEEVYIKLGFKVDYSREDLEKLRRYILHRQQEIIQSLKMV